MSANRYGRADDITRIAYRRLSRTNDRPLFAIATDRSIENSLSNADYMLLLLSNRNWQSCRLSNAQNNGEIYRRTLQKNMRDILSLYIY